MTPLFRLTRFVVTLRDLDRDREAVETVDAFDIDEAATRALYRAASRWDRWPSRIAFDRIEDAAGHVHHARPPVEVA